MSEHIEFQELYEHPILDFKQHLDLPGNNRILFSGIYGIGKTSFLKNFFKSQEVNSDASQKYDTYHLFPVNYSIASNEDIVRYLKYDIIFQLLSKSMEFPENVKSYIESLPGFVKKSFGKIIFTFLSMIPKIGKDIIGSYEKLQRLKDDFFKYHKSENQNDSDLLIDFMANLEKEEGSIFENDVITKIISLAVQNNNKRKSILIIDDLDRIDPEHVFRIMNVFAAHLDWNDSNSDKNKFGFDTVILVCDFKNIKNLFHHKYGNDIDFKGYVDKFYSSNVFHFDNRKSVNSIIEKCLNKVIDQVKVNVPEKEAQLFVSHVNDGFLKYFLECFIFQRIINLRSVLKILRLNSSTKNSLKFAKYIDISETKLSVAVKLKMLISIFGDVDHFKSSLNRLKVMGDFPRPIREYFGHFAFIISLNESVTSREKSGEIKAVINGNNLLLKYEFDFHDRFLSDVQVFSVASNQGESLEPFKPNNTQYIEFLLLAIDRLTAIGYIN